jgi:hypothetical protein
MTKKSTSPYILCAALAALACLPLIGCSKTGTSDANAGVTPTPASSAMVTPTPTPSPSTTPTQ